MGTKRRVAIALIIGIFLPVIVWAQWSTSSNDIYNSNSGYVGVGTTTPQAKLHVVRPTGNLVAVSGRGPSGGDVLNQLCIEGASCTYWGLDAATNNAFLGVDYTNKDDLVVSQNGNIGIGTASPSTKLHVAGDVTVSGNISAKYQDIAEWVPASESIPAGSVVVLDDNRDNSVVLSSSSYDTHVAGVISNNPGLVLGESSPDKVRVATTGRVRVRVNASHGAIHRGDLLVTSDNPGMAMKSEPATFGGVEMHRPGTIIGKALEGLAEGEGEILVLLSLQ